MRKVFDSSTKQIGTIINFNGAARFRREGERRLVVVGDVTRIQVTHHTRYVIGCIGQLRRRRAGGVNVQCERCCWRACAASIGGGGGKAVHTISQRGARR